MKRVRSSTSSLLVSSYKLTSYSLIIQRLLFCFSDVGFESCYLTLEPNSLGLVFKVETKNEDILQPKFLNQIRKVNTYSDISLVKTLRALSDIAKVSVALKTKTNQIYLLKICNKRVTHIGITSESRSKFMKQYNLIIEANNIFYNIPVRLKQIRLAHAWKANLLLNATCALKDFALMFPSREYILKVSGCKELSIAVLSQFSKSLDITCMFTAQNKVKMTWQSSVLQREEYTVKLYVGKATTSKLFSTKKINFFVKELPCELKGKLRRVVNQTLLDKQQDVCFLLLNYEDHNSVFDIIQPSAGIYWQLLIKTSSPLERDFTLLMKLLKPHKTSSALTSFHSHNKFKTFLQPVRSIKFQLDNKIKKFKKQKIKVLVKPKLRNSTHTVNLKLDKSVLQDLHLITQLDKNYLIALADKQLLIFDQHAVDERIHLEYIEANFNNLLKQVDHQIEYQLTTTELYLIQANRTFLFEIGFNFEVKQSKMILCQVPSFLSTVLQKKSDILKCCGNSTFLKDLKASKACRNSSMFGDELSYDEGLTLVNNLSKTNYPFQCAHGRPTVAPFLLEQKVTSLAKREYYAYRDFMGAFSRNKS